uniref:Ig-like domain-containing protein n=1 Tax=Tetraodon nigroviridis TaxID=99883 RepID=H3C4V8_TETNG
EYVYWYKQQKGKSLQFMGSVVAGLANFEGIYQSGFEAAIVTKKHSTLTITRVGREDGAAYLCAAIKGQAHYDPAFFGSGTRLTVL